MFGGAGIFADDVMFALVDEGVIYLKADQATIPAFEREGLRPFTYSTKTGRRALTSYWCMPERLYDDSEELARWATAALAAARGASTAAKRQTRPQVKRRKREA